MASAVNPAPEVVGIHTDKALLNANWAAVKAEIEALQAGGGGGSGDVVGPASATDNSLARFDGTTGKLLKDGAVIGVDVQAYDPQLDTWAGLAPSANAQSLVTAADYAAMRTLLELEAGTDFLSPAAIAAAYQPLDADLTAIAALTTTSFGRGLLELADDDALAALVDGFFLTPAEGNAAYQPLDSDLTSWAGVTRASGFDTWVATPSSANLRALLTDETGSGALVFGTSPSLTTSALLSAGFVFNFDSGDVTITHGTNLLAIAGGNVGIGTESNPQSPLTVSQNAAAGIATSTNALFSLIGVDNTTAIFDLTSFQATPGGSSIFFRQARGSGAAPRRLNSGDPIGTFGGRGAYAADDSTNADFVTTSKVNLVFWARENWTSTAQGADFSIYTTKVGGTTRVESVRMPHGGGIAVQDGITAPGATTGFATIYVDTADGDLKVVFGDGTVKTIMTDT